MLGVSPLWSRAVLRSAPPGGWGLLLVAALLAATTSAAAVPLVVEQSSDSSLRSVLATVPPGARLADTTAVRVVGGRSPRSEDSQLLRLRLDAIPGLTPSTLTAVSVGPETHPSQFFRPLVAAGDRSMRARLAAVEDPEAALVVTARDPQGRRGAWLPEPVAAELGVAPGDTVTVLVQTYDADRPPPPDTPPPVRVPLTVAGLYAVAADERRPADPAGSTAWSRRTGLIPSDTEFSALPAYLVVTDVETADRAGQAIGDDLLWAVESELEPGASLATAQQAAAGVAEVRSDVRAEENQPIGPLRVGLASGLEALVSRATGLADAIAERIRLLAGAGVAAGLLALFALAVLLARDRRQELQHGAAVGVGALRVTGLWVLESLAPAVVAMVLGVGGALLVLRFVGSGAAVTPSATTASWTVAAVVAATGALIVGLVGGVACAVGERPESLRGRRHVPWVPLLVVVTATALISTITTQAVAPGPVALVVPALVAVSVGAVVATRRRMAAAAAPVARAARIGPGRVAVARRTPARARRRRAGARRHRHDPRPGHGAALRQRGRRDHDGRRRPRGGRRPAPPRPPSSTAPGCSTPAPPASRRARSSRRARRSRRAASRRSRRATACCGARWCRSTATTATATCWPSTRPPSSATADWGQGDYLAEVRQAATELAAAAPAEQDGGPIPVIAVNEPTLATGDEAVISGQEWQSYVRVIASVSTFPGQGDRPMIVATAPSLLPRWGRSDPRLKPAAGQEPPRAYSEAWVWSSRPVTDLTTMLERRKVSPTALTTREQAEAQPALVAAASTLSFQVVLAGFLALAAVVAAALHSRRVSRRSRASDALLARAGPGRRRRTTRPHLGDAHARGAGVRQRGGRGRGSSRRSARCCSTSTGGCGPAYELHLTWPALLVTAALPRSSCWRWRGGSARATPPGVAAGARRRWCCVTVVETPVVAVRCQRLVKMYATPTGETQALRGVEAAFVSGTVSAVTGPSGSGKSSLLSILALRERQSGGELEVLGDTVSALPVRRLVALRRDHVAWVAQRPADSLLPAPDGPRAGRADRTAARAHPRRRRTRRSRASASSTAPTRTSASSPAASSSAWP